MGGWVFCEMNHTFHSVLWKSCFKHAYNYYLLQSDVRHTGLPCSTIYKALLNYWVRVTSGGTNWAWVSTSPCTHGLGEAVPLKDSGAGASYQPKQLLPTLTCWGYHTAHTVDSISNLSYLGAWSLIREKFPVTKDWDFGGSSGVQSSFLQNDSRKYSFKLWQEEKKAIVLLFLSITKTNKLILGSLQPY